MALVVRAAQPADAPVIALLGRVTFEQTFGHLFTAHPDDLAAYLNGTFAVGKIAGSMAKEVNRYWLALDDGLPIGYAKMKHPSRHRLVVGEDTGEGVGQLQKIYVLQGFHDRRAGHGLMQAVRGEASARGIATLWLAVLDSNRRALDFYRRDGWQTVGSDRYSVGAQTFDYAILRVGTSR